MKKAAKTAGGWLLVIGIAWFLVTNPVGAGHATTSGIDLLKGIGHSLAIFFTVVSSNG